MKIHEAEIQKLDKSIKEAELDFEMSKAKLEALKKTLADFQSFNRGEWNKA